MLITQYFHTLDKTQYCRYLYLHRINLHTHTEEDPTHNAMIGSYTVAIFRRIIYWDIFYLKLQQKWVIAAQINSDLKPTKVKGKTTTDFDDPHIRPIITNSVQYLFKEKLIKTSQTME